MVRCEECGHGNRDGAKFCEDCATPLATHEPSPKVRKTVTIVFCDVVGSTALGEALDPESLRHVMERYFDAMRAAIERHGGTVEKFIGDAVMAVFGVPRVHEDDALRAVRAAAEMRQALTTLNAELGRDHGMTLACRIGVNTGEVVAGAGDQTIVTGDAVNVAARLEQAAATGEILIGEQTFRLCRDAVEVGSVDPLDLKGKRDAVPAHRLLRVVEGAPAHARRFDAPLVGRTDELALLREAFDRTASERRCHLLTVLGVAGVGKSRLAAAFAAGLEDEATVWRGRCLSYGEGITYWPLLEIFREAGVESELELALKRPTPAETAWAVRTFLEREARTRPLVLVLDDVHWAEPTFLDLVEHIADLSNDAPIFILSLARPEVLDDRPAWAGGKPNATVVHLEPLSSVETGELIDELAGENSVDEAVRRRIVDGAEGNPLFAEEMLALVVEGADDVEVPASIQALLAARLERLPLAERRVLEVAAVEGKAFHLSAVAELAPERLQQQVLAALVSLVRKDLVRPDPAEPGDDAFGFRHQLIRDAAYQSLAKAERAELHERFAGWIETHAGAARPDVDEIVGYHLEQASTFRTELAADDDVGRMLAGRAAAVLSRAGERAFARSDMPAAINLMGRASRLLVPGDPARTAILPDLGVALGAVGNLAEADLVLAQAVQEARALGDAGLEARAICERVLFFVGTDPEGRVQECRTEGERMVAALEGTGEDRALAKAWSLIGQADLNGCRFEHMEHAMTRSLEHAERAGDLQQRSEALTILAIAVANFPEPVADGIAKIHRLRAMVAEGSQADGALLVELAVLTSMAGNLVEARRLVDRGRSIFRELGMVVWWAAFGMEAGMVELYAGEPDVEESLLREACETLDGMGEMSFLSSAAANLGRALVALGRPEEAEMWTIRSEEAASSEDLPSQVGWRSARAKVLAERGSFDEALRLAHEAVDLAERSDGPAFTGEAALDLAEVLQLADERRERKVRLEQALELFEQKGVVRQAEQARTRLAELAAEP